MEDGKTPSHMEEEKYRTEFRRISMYVLRQLRRNVRSANSKRKGLHHDGRGFIFCFVPEAVFAQEKTEEKV